MSKSNDLDEAYGRCTLCAKDIGRVGMLMQRCQPCSLFGFVGAGGTTHYPIPMGELFGVPVRIKK